MRKTRRMQAEEYTRSLTETVQRVGMRKTGQHLTAARRVATAAVLCFEPAMGPSVGFPPARNGMPLTPVDTTESPSPVKPPTSESAALPCIADTAADLGAWSRPPAPVALLAMSVEAASAYQAAYMRELLSSVALFRVQQSRWYSATSISLRGYDVSESCEASGYDRAE